MKKALILGASGLVGSSLLNQMVISNDFDEIRILVRKKMDLNHPKVLQIIVDYEHLSQDIFKDITTVFCCLGTTIKKAGSKEAFKKVDYDYPLISAKMALNAGVKQFLIITAMGANANSFVFYNKIKGQIEEALAELPFDAVMIFRPSLLLGDRTDARFGEQIATLMMNAIDFMTPAKYKAIHVNQVAKAMHKKAQEQVKGFQVYENDVLLSL